MTDPTVPGTRAHLRWHKDDSATAMKAYAAEFETYRVLHEHEVCDSEMPAKDVALRAQNRTTIGAGHTHEPQSPTFGDREGLLGDGLGVQIDNPRATTTPIAA
jgi:hypothetical protein